MATSQQQDAGRGECSPCRGTGEVISALGGQPRQVTCPWCDGSGRFSPGGDAQREKERGTASRPD